jgi:hypothetical protein
VASVSALAVEPMRRGATSKLAWVAVLVLLVLGGALGAFLLIPRQGRLVVEIRGPSDKLIDSVQVFVDGTKKCDTSPCVVDNLESRSHFVKVAAAGYATPEPQEVEVVGGGEKRLKVQLAASAGSTGLKVTAEGTGLRLWLDGKEIGPLPQELKDVTPGEHAIRIAGNDRFQSYEEKLMLEPDQTKVIGPLTLKVVRGLAIIEAGKNSDDAKVWLVSGNERRPLPELPIKIDINTDKSYRLSATKKGFAPLDVPITFEPGNAQKRFSIDMRREGEAASGGDDQATQVTDLSPAPPSTGVGGGRTPRPVTPAPTPPSQPVAQPATAGATKININSIPASNAILDGRPIGKTPRTNITTTPGSHTVVFVHPEKGRKQVVVNAVAGKTTTASVRF